MCLAVFPVTSYIEIQLYMLHSLKHAPHQSPTKCTSEWPMYVQIKTNISTVNFGTFSSPLKETILNCPFPLPQVSPEFVIPCFKCSWSVGIVLDQLIFGFFILSVQCFINIDFNLKTSEAKHF